MLTILADDLTGAADSSSPWVHVGRRAVVCLPGSTPVPEADVMALDLELRGATDEQAEMELARAARAVDGPVYVKIDSTLRGPVRGLVRGIRRARPRAQLLVCPAFPAQGRTLHDGGVRLHGQELDGAWLGSRGVRPHEWADAGNDDDLRSLATRIDGVTTIGVGSAGLARAWAHTLLGESNPSGGPRPPMSQPVVGDGQVTVVIGTQHPATVVQLEALAASGFACRIVRIDVQRDPIDIVFEHATGVVITGGDTARAVLRSFGCSELDVVDEVEMGVPVLRLRNGRYPGMWAVLKSGGFGGTSTLIDAVRHLSVRADP